MASKNGVQGTRLPRGLAVLLALLATAVFINYIDRGNLSIAAPLLKDELGVNPARLGFLLSAFFWTYAALQPLYGWLVDRLNVYWLFAACFGVWSLATAATGLVHVFAGLVLLRFLLGISEAVISGELQDHRPELPGRTPRRGERGGDRRNIARPGTGLAAGRNADGSIWLAAVLRGVGTGQPSVDTGLDSLDAENRAG